LAPWTLAAPASGQVSAHAQQLDDACLTSGDARLCVDGGHSDRGTHAQARLDSQALAYLAPHLPDDLDVTGALSARMEANLPAGGTPDVTMHMETTPGRIAARQADGETAQVLNFDPARVDMALADTGLDVELSLPLTDTGAINAQL